MLRFALHTNPVSDTHCRAQTHSIGAKACLILGLAFRAIEVKAEDGYALRGEALRAAIEEDEAKGLVPFMLSESGLEGTLCSNRADIVMQSLRSARRAPAPLTILRR